MGENICEIRNLSKRYGDFALERVNFDIPRGAIVGLIGENGAGKSTTINCLLGEVVPDGGEIRIFGRDIADESVRDRIGVVFDENHFPEIFTPAEIGRFMAGIYSDWDADAYRSRLTNFGLPEDKKTGEFSRGMKVKLAFAVALSHNAEFLVLDEATSGLDPVVRDDILDALLEFVQDERHSVLVSSHITSDLEKIADYIAFLHRGKLVFCLPKDELADEYGVVHCGAADFERLEPEIVVAWRREEFQTRALVRNRVRAAELLPDAIVAPAELDEIMLFYAKGDFA